MVMRIVGAMGVVLIADEAKFSLYRRNSCFPPSEVLATRDCGYPRKPITEYSRVSCYMLCQFRSICQDICINEEVRGWFPIGYHSGRILETEDAALNEAMSKVPWLREVVDAG